MKAITFPGDRQLDIIEIPDPTPGPWRSRARDQSLGHARERPQVLARHRWPGLARLQGLGRPAGGGARTLRRGGGRRPRRRQGARLRRHARDGAPLPRLRRLPAMLDRLDATVRRRRQGSLRRHRQSVGRTATHGPHGTTHHSHLPPRPGRPVGHATGRRHGRTRHRPRRQPQRLARAKDFGAAETINPATTDDVVGVIKKLTQGLGHICRSMPRHRPTPAHKPYSACAPGVKPASSAKAAASRSTSAPTRCAVRSHRSVGGPAQWWARPSARALWRIAALRWTNCSRIAGGWIRAKRRISCLIGRVWAWV